MLLDQECVQQKTENVEYDGVSHNDSEIQANLERHKDSKIEDRVRCRRCLKYSTTSEAFRISGRMFFYGWRRMNKCSAHRHVCADQPRFHVVSSVAEKKKQRRKRGREGRKTAHRSTVTGGSTTNFLAELVMNSNRTDASDSGMRGCSGNLLRTFLCTPRSPGMSAQNDRRSPFHHSINNIPLFLLNVDVLCVCNRQELLLLWSYVARQHRRGPEAVRATHQQSLQHVRPWQDKDKTRQDKIHQCVHSCTQLVNSGRTWAYLQLGKNWPQHIFVWRSTAASTVSVALAHAADLTGQLWLPWKNLEESQKNSKKTRNSLNFAQKHNCGTILERYLEDEQYQKANARTRTHADRHGRIWQNGVGKGRITKLNLKNERCQRDQYTVVQPYQGGSSNTVKTKEHHKNEQFVRW